MTNSGDKTVNADPGDGMEWQEKQDFVRDPRSPHALQQSLEDSPAVVSADAQREADAMAFCEAPIADAFETAK